MTYETMYNHICVLLQEYDLHTGNRAADGVISNPEKWVSSEYFPFYASAAALLIETSAKLDTKTTPRTAIAAITRIYKNCNASRPEMCGLFTYGDRFVICDGYRLLRLTNDISSIPHVENDFDVASVMKGLGPTSETLQLPTVGELRAHIITHNVKRGRKTITTSYFLDNFIHVNPQYLIDMIQALPGCTAYKPQSQTSPIYFEAPNGDDGILLPVRPPHNPSDDVSNEKTTS